MKLKIPKCLEDQMQNYPVLPAEDQIELIKKYKSGNNEARDELIFSNLRFVLSIAQPLAKNIEDLEDLVQEGNSGLEEAAYRFDLNEDTNFLTYAYYWIKQRVYSYLKESGSIIRQPNGVRSLPYNIILESSIKDRNNELSTDDFMGIYIIENKDQNIAVKSAEFNELKESIKSNLFKLSSRETYIVIVRFGLYGNKEKTCVEIATSLGISNEGARKILIKSLQKLRHSVDESFRDY